MKQVMNYHKDNGLLNMIRRTDPMIITKEKNTFITVRIKRFRVLLRKQMIS